MLSGLCWLPPRTLYALIQPLWVQKCHQVHPTGFGTASLLYVKHIFSETRLLYTHTRTHACTVPFLYHYGYCATQKDTSSKALQRGEVKDMSK